MAGAACAAPAFASGTAEIVSLLRETAPLKIAHASQVCAPSSHCCSAWAAHAAPERRRAGAAPRTAAAPHSPPRAAAFLLCHRHHTATSRAPIVGGFPYCPHARTRRRLCGHTVCAGRCGGAGRQQHSPARLGVHPARGAGVPAAPARRPPARRHSSWPPHYSARAPRRRGRMSRQRGYGAPLAFPFPAPAAPGRSRHRGRGRGRGAPPRRRAGRW